MPEQKQSGVIFSVNMSQDSKRSYFAWLLWASCCHQDVSNFFLTTKNLELLRGLPWPTPETQPCSMDLPQDEEANDKKLHRYFSGKLGGIYIAQKCSSRGAYALKDLQKYWQ